MGSIKKVVRQSVDGGGGLFGGGSPSGGSGGLIARSMEPKVSPIQEEIKRKKKGGPLGKVVRSVLGDETLG